MADHPAFEEDHSFFTGFLCGGAKQCVMGDALTPSEVDFERNPTGLYIAVHTKNWALALQRVGSYPNEAGIWVVRMDDDSNKSNSGNGMSSPRAKSIIPSFGKRPIRWRMLPLHAAVLFGAPIPVIKAIIKANPNACSSPDDQGMVPLHLAFRAGSVEDVVVTLLEAYPEAIELVDYKGRLPSMLVPKHSMNYADTVAEAFIRGPSHYYWSARVSGADRSRIQMEVSEKVKALEDASKQQNRMSERILDETQQQLTEEIEALSLENIELKEHTAYYEAKYDGVEEKEKVLVDHTNSLAERLRLTSLSEEHLATKLAKLEVNLKKKEAELEEMKTKSQEEKAEMEAKMQSMTDDLARVGDEAQQLTQSLAQKNEECDQMTERFQKEREMFEKQVSASKECLLELIASSKEDKKTFENDSKELRQHLATIQAELQKANQAPIDLERKLESRLIDILNAQSVRKEEQRQQPPSLASPRNYSRQRQQPEQPVSYKQQSPSRSSPRNYSYQRQQPEKPVTSSYKKKHEPKKGLSLDDVETYQVQSRDDDDVLSIDSDIDTAVLGNLSPEQQEALLNLDLSGNTAEVAIQLKRIPGLTNSQVTLLLQVASSLAA
mmetsp:Transcript_2738/g.4170  ORF Transcript_2738/g.4170 Transcript_2738/m.4170 type:complete len:608 (+) Transcript_2738:101-1924(+)|eukprot:CAMPEP_0201722742 /NCGR_PEP_ID=MMETSP0593-20130828/6997_1 /ASSEMBLY_ACC=CAM_ASM_000672 /TAXON_ID=267983 /ORGANISM="Skeletonema japonicum, Strain CCMP2506" /LENGTH=607 /DNA_ID=CAMNT_0048213723 /DNA_START=47 /DNA_END=1870 /DNA_ORIENTATION=-